MTLREELCRTATKAAAEKKAKAERHRELVDEYLKDICRTAAADGEFKAIVSMVNLEGSPITDEDIRVFARDYNLDYTPREGLNLPVLSFDYHS